MVVGLGVAKYRKHAAKFSAGCALDGLDSDPFSKDGRQYTDAFKYMTTKRIKEIVSLMIKEGDYS